MSGRPHNEPVAVVGMACRFPGGATPDGFWNFLANGGDAIQEIPPERWDVDAYYDANPDARGKMYTRYGSFIADFDQFSPAFFGISPREAQFMDPQQRQLLEVHWEALENAGIVPQRLSQKQVGVFVGMGTTDYGDLQAAIGPMGTDAYNGTGGSHAAAAGRLSFMLGVRGPSLAIDTACSSSLVSVHLAMMSLRGGESDIALASGVNLNFAPDVFIGLCKAKMLSPDGHCKAFDASANGYVRGEGCGVLVLKRLSDAIDSGDRILALLRGSAVNHNGRSSGLTVPSGLAQQEVIRTALRNGGVDPSEVGFVEAHGTGTAVGDPIEAAALGAVFAGRSNPLLLGSVKTNCGHLEWAAGVCGLIKAILSMDRGLIPRNLHFNQPNPMIPWDRLPLRVVTETTPWPAGKRIAGVSSFGFGGTNAHVIVEQAPDMEIRVGAEERPVHALALSARSEAALREIADRMAAAVDSAAAEALPDLCYSANTGRSKFDYRLVASGRSREDFAANLRAFSGRVSAPAVRSGRAPSDPAEIVMMFTGQGSQFPRMGRELYETAPVFRETLDQCDALLSSLLDRRLLDVIYPRDDADAALIHETAYTQPALFAVEYALARLWQSWGVFPDVVLGHSVGEYVAACLAGVFSLADGLKLIAARGKLMQALPRDGTMLAIRATEERVAPVLQPHAASVSIASANGPDDLVLSGETTAIEAIEAALLDQNIPTHRLNVSHAFHSPLMEPILADFAALAGEIRFDTPSIRLISNMTGAEAGDEIATPDYWVRHIRQAVRFADSIQTAADMGATIFLEAGPRPVLCGMGRQNLPTGDQLWLPSLQSRAGDWARMLESASDIFTHGGEIDWEAFDRGYPRRKMALPTYPFERERYWFPAASGGVARGRGALRPLVESMVRSPLVKETILSASFGVASQPYLADHKVHGQLVVPGAAYLAMLASGAELFGWPSCRIDDAYFLAPLILSDAKGRTVQAVITPDDSQTDPAAAQSVTIAALASDTPGEELVRLLSGKIAPGHAAAAPPVDLGDLRARCTEVYDTGLLYDVIDSSGVEVKDGFRWVEALWLGHDEALARLHLPDAAGGLDGYSLHPALLDAGFQVAGATLGAEEQSETLLPFSVKSMIQQGDATGTVWWCHALRTGPTTWDIQTLDAEGRVIVSLEGFEMRRAPASAFLRRRVSDLLYRLDWRPMSLEIEADPAPATWLVLDNGSRRGAELRRRLAARGHNCLVVAEGAAFEGLFFDNGDGITTADPGEPGNLRALLGRCVEAADPPLRGVIHLWGVEPGAETSASPERAETLAIGLLHMVQAIAATSVDLRLCVVTSGAQAVIAGEAIHPEQAPLWGMQRGLMLEAPEIRLTCVDAATDGDAEISALLDELQAPPGEAQVAYRGGERFVARLVRCPEAAPPAIDGPFRLQLKDYGSPDNLQLVPITRQKPGRGQIEIAVTAAALNFRDVVIALGMLKEFYAEEMGITRASDIPLGFDCAGTVAALGEGVTDLAIGDLVMAPAVGGFASHVIAFRDGVMRVPTNVDPVTAAAIPSVFWTAYHSLVQLAKLKAGESILIHAAAGGVGLAAIQIAQAVGAEIFTTASPPKWDHLRSQGIVQISNSRTLDFADEIMAATGGEGVDVVLNSLTGEVVDRSFQVLKHGGRFIEIGRLEGGLPEQARARPDAEYFTFELGAVIARDVAESMRTGAEIRDLFEKGVARPLPMAAYTIENAAEAYRFMQQTRHVGKVVLTLNEATVRADASYLVTGGLGGLGLKVAEFLVDAGARHIVLSARSSPSEEALAVMEALRERGASVVAVRGDVSIPKDTAAMIAACECAAPLRGVIHAAGLLRESLVRNQSADTYRAAMAPKVRGAWELHSLTRELPLDFFVLFSSMASLSGSPGQTNYCAANAYLDALATYRRARGLPAISLCWGPWAEAGMAAESELGGGIEKLSVEDGLATLKAMLRAPRTARGETGVMKMRWDVYGRRWPSPAASTFYSELLDHSRAATAAAEDFLKAFRAAPEEARRSLLEAHVRDALRQVLGLSASQEIRNSEPWTDLGVDSLMMVEIKNRLEGSLRLSFPIELMMREVSVDTLSDFAIERLSTIAAEVPTPEPAVLEDQAAMRAEIRESMLQIPQCYTEVEDQRARQVLIGGRWRCDFASCNYLGFDLEPEIMAAITGPVKKWGTHPSWTRAVASPSLYPRLERELAAMVGVPDTLVFPSISLLHLGVLPALAGSQGVIFSDTSAHHSIAEACMRAKAEGTTWVEFRHNDVEDLTRKLARYAKIPNKIIATDGIYSMGSPNPPLAEYARLAREYDAILYVDDAHGFGVIGGSPDEALPYGYGGNGLVNHLGLDFERDRIMYVAGLSKAFSSYAAFITCRDPELKMMLQTSGPYVFSGPTAVACLATALAGISLNRRDGDVRRAKIHRLTRRLVSAAYQIGFEVDNDSDFPIVGVVMGGWDEMVTACNILWDHDILITPATFPAVPITRNLVRFSITAANTEAELDLAIAALHAVWQALHPAATMALETSTVAAE